MRGRGSPSSPQSVEKEAESSSKTRLSPIMCTELKFFLPSGSARDAILLLMQHSEQMNHGGFGDTSGSRDVASQQMLNQEKQQPSGRFRAGEGEKLRCFLTPSSERVLHPQWSQTSAAPKAQKPK